jgi:outer membrane biogenesis lipoprotein LolB
MNHRQSQMQQRGAAMVVGVFVLLLITACASDQSKPLPQPTPDQVRGHADRTFEKLKQEEQERGAQPPTPRY